MFDFIKALFGLKTMPSPTTVRTVQEVAEKMVEPVIQETLKITEKNWKNKEVETAPAPAPKTKRYTKKQLTEMTKKEVDELGLELFNVKLDRRVQKQVLIQNFINTQREFHKK